MRRLKLFLVTFLYLFINSHISAQKKTIAIGFWNVENLYDTINDPLKEDDEFTPAGNNKWGSERYKNKIEHLTEVISQMGKENVSDGLEIIGLCEIENQTVLNDLVGALKLKKRNYNIIHFDGPDARGIDPAFLYDSKSFKVNRTARYNVKLVTDSLHKTREQLVVSGLLHGEEICFIICHWPSRRGGEVETKTNRTAAANVTRHIVDSLQKNQPNCKLIIMGDLNDNPSNESIKINLQTNSDKTGLKEKELFDTMEDLQKKGLGTICYKDKWDLFDQFIISKSLVDDKKGKLHFLSSQIFNNDFVKEPDGKYKGQPFRTYAGSKYLGGYSDHFAVYLLLEK